MRSGPVVVAGYALTGLLLVAIAGAVASGVLPEVDGRAVWVAGVLSLVVQVVAFAALMALRDRRLGLLMAWAAGVVMRFGVVLVAGIWLVRVAGYPPLALLLSLAGFVFALLLLEPVFFRLGAANR
ncbi:MAG TPA: hypothetical protein VNZ57_12175 [Longimicrobiales bacterium]|nr:hypothetical protein [Longimicrobiales bacterium]